MDHGHRRLAFLAAGDGDDFRLRMAEQFDQFQGRVARGAEWRFVSWRETGRAGRWGWTHRAETSYYTRRGAGRKGPDEGEGGLGIGTGKAPRLVAGAAGRCATGFARALGERFLCGRPFSARRGIR